MVGRGFRAEKQTTTALWPTEDALGDKVGYLIPIDEAESIGHRHYASVPLAGEKRGGSPRTQRAVQQVWTYHVSPIARV